MGILGKQGDCIIDQPLFVGISEETAVNRFPLMRTACQAAGKTRFAESAGKRAVFAVSLGSVRSSTSTKRYAILTSGVSFRNTGCLGKNQLATNCTDRN
jgi:hypothetical protein